MRTGRPKVVLTVSSEERAHLLAIARSRPLPAALTLRARIVLVCEREPSNAVVATRLSVGPHTISKWRKRFIADRIEGLYDEMRSGRPRTVEDEAVAELITKTLARKPKAATHWSVRAIAKETGIAKSTVHRVFQLFGLQLHRTRSDGAASAPQRLACWAPSCPSADEQDGLSADLPAPEDQRAAAAAPDVAISASPSDRRSAEGSVQILSHI